MPEQKLLIRHNGKTFFIKDDSKDFHSQYGLILAKDIQKPEGTVIETNKGTKLTIATPNFLDKMSKIKRGAQIIPMKDIGSIITETGINKNSVCIDAGAGSGATALFLANITKKVTTYEVREDHYNLVKKNIEFMNMSNLKIKLGSIYEPISEKNIDLINLDVPEPWQAIETVKSALKIGGYVISYSPTIPQVMDYVEAIKENKEFLYIKTIEMTEREWDVAGRKVRPKSQTIGHSGFLTFARRIQ